MWPSRAATFFCPVYALLAGQNVEIIHFVRPNRDHRTNSAKEAGDGENLTKGFQPYHDPAPAEARST